MSARLTLTLALKFPALLALIIVVSHAHLNGWETTAVIVAWCAFGYPLSDMVAEWWLKDWQDTLEAKNGPPVPPRREAGR